MNEIDVTEAIKILRNEKKLNEIKLAKSYDSYCLYPNPDDQMTWNECSAIDVAYDMAIQALENSPTEMPGTSDLISRQMAVDAICKEWCNCSHDDCENKNMMEAGFDPCDGCSDVDAIMDLPSVQPEIIHCKDCANWKVQAKDVKGDGLGCCNFHNANFVTGEGYCYWAERRTDE